jgi:Putative MetA-pathway of phenol degradation
MLSRLTSSDRGQPREIRKFLRREALLAVGFLAAVTLTRAGPPFATDDPEPVDYQHGEIYLGSQYQHGSEGAGGTLPHFEANYGVLPNLQLHLIAPVAFDAPSGANRQFGYGDTELGAKYRFLEEADGRPQVAVFPLVELPTGNSARGLGSGRTQIFLPVWFQKSFGTWTTYGGAGYWINPGAGNRNWWFTGWTAQKKVLPNLTLGAEIFHETAKRERGDSDTKMNAGVIWDLDETRHILASVGPTIQGPAGYQAYLAFQFTFGPDK